MKSIASLAPGANTVIKCPPLGLYIFTLLWVHIDQIPLIWVIFLGKMRSNPHLLPVGGKWGHTLIGALPVSSKFMANKLMNQKFLCTHNNFYRPSQTDSTEMG